MSTRAPRNRFRSALVEGASWWADAFEAAGFEDAYRVELLPEGAHPADVRYNVVQWVHRQTRGWSYGGGVSDPRTGEMLKGHVILGSQRVRQGPYDFSNRWSAPRRTVRVRRTIQPGLRSPESASWPHMRSAMRSAFFHNMAASTKRSGVGDGLPGTADYARWQTVARILAMPTQSVSVSGISSRWRGYTVTRAPAIR